ncbi:MAG: hypothetical protein ACRBN8_11685 [Nannocystales bacterium]
MSLIAAVLEEEEAEREAPARQHRKSLARGRVGFVLTAGFGCALAALAGGLGASWLDTPELDQFEALLEVGGVDALEDALSELEAVSGADSSSRARIARAHARAQQAAWGSAFIAEADGLLAPGDDGVHAARASALLAGMEGTARDAEGAWARGLAAGRSLEVTAMHRAVDELQAQRRRPAGATRTLAALQFSLGDVSAAFATLEEVHTPQAAADRAFHAAWVGPVQDQAPILAQEVPGRNSLLRAFSAIRDADHEQAVLALADARGHLLPWDPVAVSTALRLSFIAADAQGLRSWSKDDSRPWSAEVRTLAAAYADVLSGQTDSAQARLDGFSADAPWVAYLGGFVAAEQQQWPDAMRHCAVARRGMAGRAELDVLAAWVATHVLDAEVAHAQLVGLSEHAAWAPRVWTALARASERVGAPQQQVERFYERALEVEHRPAAAAAALAARASGDEALHLWTMASEFEPAAAQYRVSLGMTQVGQGRLAEGWSNASSLEHGDADAWLSLVQLALFRARAGGTVDSRAEGWVRKAEAAAATTEAVEVARLQVAFARGEDVSKQARALSRDYPRRADAAALSIRSQGRAGRVLAARRDAVLARSRLERPEIPLTTLALAEVLREHGELREAAQLAFKAWSGLSPEADALEALVVARTAADIWLDLGNASGARSIARELTSRLPASPDAWLLRARVQIAAGVPASACRSLGRARTLDPDVVLEGSRCEADPA